MGLNEDAIKFVGNGFFGMDPNGELVLGSFLKQSSGLFPGLNIEIDGVTGIEEEEAVLTDFRNGVLKIFKCFSLENSECGCVVNSIYAHRIRKEVMVQEILISNPTKSTIRLNLNRQSSNWWANSKIGDITTHQRNIANSSYVVVCSDPPGKISVSQKREETLKFHCVITNSAQKIRSCANIQRDQRCLQRIPYYTQRIIFKDNDKLVFIFPSHSKL
ncbi:unnamed protein product [Caenorhabditis angaria]|uniref:Uncharacterized protein n=1 Tax=Caenorhabditis angaria TaxID=860376 RepID=A0A9P1N3X0_9PELO|nr:unnamed protein product [Caenorhabditis angaria]